MVDIFGEFDDFAVEDNQRLCIIMTTHAHHGCTKGFFIPYFLIVFSESLQVRGFLRTCALEFAYCLLDGSDKLRRGEGRESQRSYRDDVESLAPHPRI